MHWRGGWSAGRPPLDARRSGAGYFRRDPLKVLRAKNGVLPIGLSTVVELLTDGARNGWSDEQLRTLLIRLVPDFQHADEPAEADAEIASA